MTYCDFAMYEILDQHKIFAPEIIGKFPKLVAYLQRFEDLPTIRAYRESDKFVKYPLNNRMAKFGAV